MRLANQVTWAAYKAAHQSLHDGMSQAELEKLIMAAYPTARLSRRGRHRDRGKFFIPPRLNRSPNDSRRLADHVG
jgi:hypothetical protein